MTISERDHFEDAVAALIRAATYRQQVAFQAPALIEAALPHLRAMIEREGVGDDLLCQVERAYDWPDGAARVVVNQLAEHGAILIRKGPR